MKFKQWIKTPKGYVTIAMVSYLLIASIGSQDIKGLENAVIAVCASVLLDVIYSKVENRKRILPDGAVITGLIISLILGTTSSWLIVAITAAIAISSKHLFAYKKRPIFNPAAFGLFVSVLAFQSNQSWWGSFGDLPTWTIIFLLIGGYKIVSKVNKYPQVFSFFGTLFVLLFVLGILNIGDATDALRPPFINADIFFGFFMLTDLPTSPVKGKDQVIFGMIVAIVSVAISSLFGGLTYLFIGLFVGNLYYLSKKRTPASAKRMQTRSA